MADLDELLVHKLYAPQTRRFQELDLRLHEQVERDLGNEQARAGTRRVPDGRPDILVVEVVRRVDRRERGAEDVVEDVVYPCAARELLRGDVDARAVDGRDKVARELRHQPQHERALLQPVPKRISLSVEEKQHKEKEPTWFLSP